MRRRANNWPLRRGDQFQLVWQILLGHVPGPRHALQVQTIQRLGHDHRHALAAHGLELGKAEQVMPLVQTTTSSAQQGQGGLGLKQAMAVPSILREGCFNRGE